LARLAAADRIRHNQVVLFAVEWLTAFEERAPETIQNDVAASVRAMQKKDGIRHSVRCIAPWRSDRHVVNTQFGEYLAALEADVPDPEVAVSAACVWPVRTLRHIVEFQWPHLSPQSAKPAVRITLPHFSVSSTSSSPKPAEVIGTGTLPSSVS